MRLEEPKWKEANQNQDGLLFFSQRLDEMLFDYSIDLYKAPILNTHLLIREYISVYNDKSVDNKYLKWILEELCFSLRQDLILTKYWGKDNIAQAIHTLNELGANSVISFIKYLNHIMGNNQYLSWCKDYADSIISKYNEKKKIERLLRCLVPELVGAGYSPRFIRWYNRKCILFAATPSFHDFISRFDCKEREYSVYIAAEKWITSFAELLNSRLSFTFESDDNFISFRTNTVRSRPSDDHVILHIDGIKALDDQTAAIAAFKKINLFLRFYTAVDNKTTPQFLDTAMVIEKACQSPSFVSFGISEYNVIQGMKIKEASRYTEHLITKLMSQARCSLNTLLRAVDLHNYSLKSSDYNGGFLNLWSALEVLSIKTMGENDLSQVSASILPILGLNFFSATVSDLTDQIKSALPDTSFKRLLDQINYGDSWEEKVASLLFLEEYANLRDNLEHQLILYPVIRYRIHILSENAGNRKLLLGLCNRYITRVSWHLSRIYRARNSIVHSGATPTYIRNLGEHLHYYFDALLMECLSRLCDEPQLCTVENAILDAKLSYDVLEKTLQEKGPLTPDLIPQLIHPNFAKPSTVDDCHSCCDS